MVLIDKMVSKCSKRARAKARVVSQDDDTAVVDAVGNVGGDVDDDTGTDVDGDEDEEVALVLVLLVEEDGMST